MHGTKDLLPKIVAGSDRKRTIYLNLYLEKHPCMAAYICSVPLSASETTLSWPHEVSGAPSNVSNV